MIAWGHLAGRGVWSCDTQCAARWSARVFSRYQRVRWLCREENKRRGAGMRWAGGLLPGGCSSREGGHGWVLEPLAWGGSLVRAKRRFWAAGYPAARATCGLRATDGGPRRSVSTSVERSGRRGGAAVCGGEFGRQSRNCYVGRRPALVRSGGGHTSLGWTSHDGGPAPGSRLAGVGDSVLSHLGGRDRPASPSWPVCWSALPEGHLTKVVRGAARREIQVAADESQNVYVATGCEASSTAWLTGCSFWTS